MSAVCTCVKILIVYNSLLFCAKVFQKRFNGETDFYRDWNSYVNGFGDVTREHWLGKRFFFFFFAPRALIDVKSMQFHQTYYTNE